MDVLPSAAFRRTYAKLMKPTKVTVNGHAIGIWVPVDEVNFVDPGPDTTAVGILRAQKSYHDDSFNTRPFTPVPKRRG